jgi:hypothetical protein
MIRKNMISSISSYELKRCAGLDGHNTVGQTRNRAWLSFEDHHFRTKEEVYIALDKALGWLHETQD